MMRRLKALIIGGGVGGLSAGIALQRAGAEVTIFERAPEMRVEGFGLNLWPNSGRALYAMGLKQQYDEVAVPLDRYLTLSSNGHVLHNFAVNDWARTYGAPATGVRRRALSEMMAQRVGPKNVRFSHELVDVVNGTSSVTAKFGNGYEYEGDVLIGADGIHSRTRKSLFGDFSYRSNPHHSYRWRGIVELAATEIDGTAETEVYGEGSFFGSIPVGDGLAYWFASGPRLNDRDAFHKLFGSWTDTHVPGTIAATDPDTIGQTELADLATRPDSWSVGRAALLGDAAHAMMPDMAQGASQTLIDSQVLGEVFASTSDVATALEAYERLRKPASYRIADLSRKGMHIDFDGPGATVPSPIAERYLQAAEDVSVVPASDSTTQRG